MGMDSRRMPHRGRFTIGLRGDFNHACTYGWSIFREQLNCFENALFLSGAFRINPKRSSNRPIGGVRIRTPYSSGSSLLTPKPISAAKVR